jgi:hypothetical protein
MVYEFTMDVKTKLVKMLVNPNYCWSGQLFSLTYALFKVAMLELNNEEDMFKYDLTMALSTRCKIHVKKNWQSKD